MNQLAIDMFSTIGVAILCIVLGIMSLGIFFTQLSRISRADAHVSALTLVGVLNKDDWVTVHMAYAAVFEHVRIVGYATSDSMLPYELNGLMVLENAAGVRSIVRAKSVRMIVVEPPSTAPSSITS